MLGAIGAAIGGSGALSGFFGGGVVGNLLQGFTQNNGFGALFSALGNLFGGQQPGGAQGNPAEQLLGDIKNMLGNLLDGQGGGMAGNHMHAGFAPGQGMVPGDHGHGSQGCGSHGSDFGQAPHDCHFGHEGPEFDPGLGWTGKDGSKSLDEERGAARLLHEARQTDDPQQKRELIEMAMERLDKDKGLFSAVKDWKQGNNTYDKDIVKQADKMLEDIEDGHLTGSNESRALDAVIDMLMHEGGVDGKPASLFA